MPLDVQVSQFRILRMTDWDEKLGIFRKFLKARW
jgi:hypothetical protein